MAVSIDAAALEGWLEEYGRVWEESQSLRRRIRELQDEADRRDERLTALANRIARLTYGQLPGLWPPDVGAQPAANPPGSLPPGQGA